jgi:trans-aconitate 2-methyltransferase
MLNAFNQTLAELHSAALGEINSWYYPSVSEYASLLEKNGLEVRFITLFDRETPLADGEAGMRNWITMFGSDFLQKVPIEKRERVFRRIEDLLRPELFRDGQWCADYRRLRFSAWK